MVEISEKYVLVVDLFFFQAEDGIRDVAVTGVQTCALPILAIIEARFRQGNGSNSALSRDHFLKRAPCLTRKEGKEDAIESFWVRIYSDKGLQIGRASCRERV